MPYPKGHVPWNKKMPKASGNVLVYFVNYWRAYCKNTHDCRHCKNIKLCDLALEKIKKKIVEEKNVSDTGKGEGK